MYSVRVSPGVNRVKRNGKWIRKLFNWFNTHMPTDETVMIYVCDNDAFIVEDDQYVIGIFTHALNRKKPPQIHISGDRNIREVLRTCLHEFVHYEQYRNNRRQTERGVNVRARSLEKIIINSIKKTGVTKCHTFN